VGLSAVRRAAGFVVLVGLTASCGKHSPAKGPGGHVWGDASDVAASPDAAIDTPADAAAEQRVGDALEDAPAPVTKKDAAVDKAKPTFDAQLGDAANGFCVGEGWCWGNTTLQGNALNSVWGTGAKDLWAVGEAGTILHWDGSAWSPVPSGTTSSLKSVWGAKANDVWAVGDGVLLRWNGKAWSNIDYQIPVELGDGEEHPTFTAREAPATRVWGTASNDVWVVTKSPPERSFQGGHAILHWDGTSWTDVAGTEPYVGVWGSGPRDVWAVADNSWIAHWDGSEWTSDRPGTFFIGGGPLWGFGPNDVWMAGGGGPDLIYHRDANGWASVSCAAAPCARMVDVWGAAANDVWTVGKGGGAFHWNGTAWSAVDSGTTQDLAGVWGSASNDVWAVGASGTIQHWDGVRWSGQASGGGSGTGKVQALAGISGVGGHMWAVGRSAHDAYAVHWDGRAWSEELVVRGGVDPNLGATNSVLSSVWGSAPDDVWAVGSEAANDSIQHWNGAKWSSFSMGTQIGLTGVWGSDRDDVWAVGGTAGGSKLLHWDGASWSKVTTGLGFTAKLNAVWGSDAEDLWVVGGDGRILHFDGTRWTPSPVDADVTLTAVWGSGPGDVWTVGYRSPNYLPKAGAIFHWDGTAWATAGPAGPLPAFYAVSGSGADDVFAVGGTSAGDPYAAAVEGAGNVNVLHWDGKAWSALAGGTSKALRGVWSTRADGTFLVGDFAGILHR
jgi:hypothetical protein